MTPYHTRGHVVIRHLHTVLLMLTPFAIACEPGKVTLAGPDDQPADDTAAEVRVTLDDSTLAQALGWEDGVPVASATWAFVHHLRYLFRDAVSDASGVIRFEPEGSGWHWIAAEKEVEIDGVRRVLGGGVKSVASPDAPTNLSLSMDDPGTLVISEVYMVQPSSFETGGTAYHGSQYIELYNNSTEVLHLDGMIVGIAYSFFVDATVNGHHSCSYTQPFREDPEAVWSTSHWQFPGSGTEHPIAPGEAVVIAVSAADHTGVHASMLDLSDADFEFRSPGAADNPAATNLEDMGMESRSSRFFITDAFWFVSTPVDVAALEVMTDDEYIGDGIDYRGFPARTIVDVAVMWWDATSSTVTSRNLPPCEHPIHPRFDALPGGYVDNKDLLVSPQRRVVRTRDWQPVLLDTNTSAVDFENVPRTPGWIPE